MPSFTTRIESLLKKTDRMKNKAIKGLLRTLKNIDHERRKRTADLEDAAKSVLRQLSDLGHNGVVTKRTATAVKIAAKSKKRIRRSPDDLKKYAHGVVEFVKAHQGCSGSEIRKAFSKIGPDIKGFVGQYSTGQKLRTVGRRSAMRYHVG